MNKQYIVEDYGLSATGSNDGHDYVDLGLNVKWATCNIDASEPEYSGGYYAWGEVNTKIVYDKSTFKWSEDPSVYQVEKEPMKGIVNSGPYPRYIYKTKTLYPVDDVAHVKWGGKWRMPTIHDFYELKTCCKWEWINVNGVVGYRVKGKKYGYTNRSIFLPAAGNCGLTTFLYKDTDCRIYSSLHDKGIIGDYLCSSLNEHSPFFANSLYFRSSGVCFSEELSYGGRTVRAVYP